MAADGPAPTSAPHRKPSGIELPKFRRSSTVLACGTTASAVLHHRNLERDSRAGEEARHRVSGTHTGDSAEGACPHVIKTAPSACCVHMIRLFSRASV